MFLFLLFFEALFFLLLALFFLEFGEVFLFSFFEFGLAGCEFLLFFGQSRGVGL